MSTHEDRALAPATRSPRIDIGRKLVEVVLSRIEKGRLTVHFPSGRYAERNGSAPGPHATIVVRNWRAFRRMIIDGSIGFSDGYIAGDWTTPNLTALIELFAVNNGATDAVSGWWVSRAARRIWHRANANTKRGSRKNIRYHYDLGNDFYAAWLDRGMQYSSALYDGADDLDTAQAAKLDRIVQLLDLNGGERVLEIGCGWGAVAERLARNHDCMVTGLTLSEEQLAYARERMERGGVAARCDLRLEDYRDCRGTFDRIVSIEMIEAVGERYWSEYFRLLRARLKPGGIAVIQAITINENRFEHYRRRPDFIQRHIFPGGMLPTDRIVRSQLDNAGFTLLRTEAFGESYARTLADWRRRFDDNWQTIEWMGFDSQFRKMWEYYLSYCEAGFKAGTLDVRLYAAIADRA